MIASAVTYLPPTCPITLAYSFSAPIAVILVSDAVEAASDVLLDEQALASRAAASGRAMARAPVRVRMTCELPKGGRAAGAARGLADEHRYGNHFH